MHKGQLGPLLIEEVVDRLERLEKERSRFGCGCGCGCGFGFGLGFGIGLGWFFAFAFAFAIGCCCTSSSATLNEATYAAIIAASEIVSSSSLMSAWAVTVGGGLIQLVCGRGAERTVGTPSPASVSGPWLNVMEAGAGGGAGGGAGAGGGGGAGAVFWFQLNAAG